jgi:hypothetical protein
MSIGSRNSVFRHHRDGSATSKSRGWKQPVRSFVQMLIRALRVCQMTNQITGGPVKVDTLEVIELLSLEIEDLPTNYLANLNALAVEDVSVHDWPRWINRATRALRQAAPAYPQ